MPAMVKNYISFNGISKMNLFRNDVFFSNGEKKINREFDFNQVIPMPKDLDVEHSLLEEMQLIYYLTDGCKYSENKYSDYIRPVDMNMLNERAYPKELYMMARNYIKERPDYEKQIFLDDGKKLMDNISMFGCMDWYEWRLKNWNTVWNASDTKIISDDEISFLTPDSSPWPVVETLLKSFPDGVAIYRFYPEQYSELELIPAYELNISISNGKLNYKKKKKLERPDLYPLYLEDNSFSHAPQKKSSYSNDDIDRIYFRLDSDLKGAFQELCKNKNVKVAQAIRGMIQVVINSGEIPDELNEEYPNPYNTSGVYKHTNIKLPKMMRRSFDAIARQNHSNMNYLIVKYMEMCLANNRIFYQESSLV